jgi:anti-sigma B factor antagonist
MATFDSLAMPAPPVSTEDQAGPAVSISRRRSGDSVVLAVEGELDAYLVDELDRCMRVEERRGAKKLRIDFSRTTFVDAGTVGMLVRAARRAGRNSWRLRVENARGLVRKVFDITELESLIDYWQRTGAAAGGDSVAKSPTVEFCVRR